MDTGTLERVGNCLPKHFPCDRCHVSFTEEEEPKQVADWIPLRPPEVSMGQPSSRFADL